MIFRSWGQSCVVCLTMVGACAGVSSSFRDQQPGDPPKSPSTASEMVVVAPQRFEEDLRPLVDHRRHDLAVEVATLEAVVQGTAGTDDAEKAQTVSLSGVARAASSLRASGR